MCVCLSVRVCNNTSQSTLDFFPWMLCSLQNILFSVSWQSDQTTANSRTVHVLRICRFLYLYTVIFMCMCTCTHACTVSVPGGWQWRPGDVTCENLLSHIPPKLLVKCAFTHLAIAFISYLLTMIQSYNLHAAVKFVQKKVIRKNSLQVELQPRACF